ncbi:hypothetical protein Gotur_001867 [Gossypium turneri]
MDNPEEDSSSAKYIENITFPSALIEKTFGETLTLMIDFKGAAQILEKGGYTQFAPHYITWYCPQAFTLSRQCKSQCINRGRYCAPDPEQGFSSGLDAKKIEKCMGDPDADTENPVLKEEQDAQVAGKGSRGDVTILPTLVVNNRQYRGKLAKGAVLKAICAGFEETTEPAVCLSGGELMWRRMNAWKIMVVVGKIEQQISQPAGIHFEEEFVNVSWLMACNSKEMDTVTVKVRIKILFAQEMDTVTVKVRIKILFARINPSRQAVTALAPVGFGYAFCVTTCVANGTSLGDCIQRCLLSEALVETLEETHLTSSFVFCTVGCTAMTCSRLSSQGRMPGNFSFFFLY